MQRSRIPALILIALAVAAAIVAPRLRPPVFHGTDLGPATPPRDFALEAADRGTVRLSDFRGRAVLLFFGYTSCPDACPLTMTRLRRVMELLGERRRDVQVLLVTVDPAVDTPRRLREYVQGFDLGFVGLTGAPETLTETARSFGAWAGEPVSTANADPAARADPATAADPHAAHAPPSATMQTTHTAPARVIPHTPHVFGLDREGRLRILWGPELTAEQMAEDVRGLLRL